MKYVLFEIKNSLTEHSKQNENRVAIHYIDVPIITLIVLQCVRPGIGSVRRVYDLIGVVYDLIGVLYVECTT